MKLNSFSLSEVGKVRKANEDAFSNADTPNGKVFVVCDGMGGHVGGAAASNLAAKSIIEYFEKEQYENIFNAIDRAFQFANEQIFAYAQAEPSLQGMGTTAVVLIIKGEDCFIGHVGDSRCYLKTDSKLHRLTKDHSYVQGLVDSGVITDEEAESHPKKNQILKALGHSLEVQGTICPSPIKVKSGDVFLLCSDGLNGMISDKIISDAIDFNDLNESGARLYEAAMDNRGADNITVVLVGVLESSHSGKSIFISYNPDNRLTTSQFDNKPDNFLTTKDFKKKKNTKLQALLLTLAVFLVFGGGVGLYMYLNDEKPGGGGTKNDLVTEQDIINTQFEDLDKRKGDSTNISDGKEVTIKDGGIEVVIKVTNGKIDGIAKKENSPNPPPSPGNKGKDDLPRNPGTKTPDNKNTELVYLLPKKMNINEIKIEIQKMHPKKLLVSDEELKKLNQDAINNLEPGEKERVNGSKLYPQKFKFSYTFKEVVKQTETTPSPAPKNSSIQLPKPMVIAEIKSLILSNNKGCKLVSDEELKMLNQNAINKLEAKEKERVNGSNSYPKGFKFIYNCK